MAAFENTVTELWVALLYTVSTIDARDTGADNDDIEIRHFFVRSHSDVADVGVFVWTLCFVACDPRFIEVKARSYKLPLTLCHSYRCLRLPTVILSGEFSGPRSRGTADKVQSIAELAQAYHQRTSDTNRKQAKEILGLCPSRLRYPLWWLGPSHEITSARGRCVDLGPT